MVKIKVRKRIVIRWSSCPQHTRGRIGWKGVWRAEGELEGVVLREGSTLLAKLLSRRLGGRLLVLGRAVTFLEPGPHGWAKWRFSRVEDVDTLEVKGMSQGSPRAYSRS